MYVITVCMIFYVCLIFISIFVPQMYQKCVSKSSLSFYQWWNESCWDSQYTLKSFFLEVSNHFNYNRHILNAWYF